MLVGCASFTHAPCRLSDHAAGREFAEFAEELFRQGRISSVPSDDLRTALSEVRFPLGPLLLVRRHLLLCRLHSLLSSRPKGGIFPGAARVPPFGFAQGRRLRLGMTPLVGQSARPNSRNFRKNFFARTPPAHSSQPDGLLQVVGLPPCRVRLRRICGRTFLRVASQRGLPDGLQHDIGWWQPEFPEFPEEPFTCHRAGGRPRPRVPELSRTSTPASSSRAITLAGAARIDRAGERLDADLLARHRGRARLLQPAHDPARRHRRAARAARAEAPPRHAAGSRRPTARSRARRARGRWSRTARQRSASPTIRAARSTPPAAPPGCPPWRCQLGQRLSSSGARSCHCAQKASNSRRPPRSSIASTSGSPAVPSHAASRSSRARRASSSAAAARRAAPTRARRPGIEEARRQAVVVPFRAARQELGPDAADHADREVLQPQPRRPRRRC